MQIESKFRPQSISPTVETLEAHFATDIARGRPPMMNYHRESPVPEAVRRSATPSAVLIPIIEDPREPRLLLTRRHHSISYPGHVCFPGGRADPHDVDLRATALREAKEEVGLDPGSVRVIGELGLYYTQTGYCIAPVVGIIERPLSLVPDPNEVSEILELPLAVVTTAESYRLWQPDPAHENAYFSLTWDGITITGPTVCLLMGFYENLAATHPETAIGC